MTDIAMNRRVFSGALTALGAAALAGVSACARSESEGGAGGFAYDDAFIIDTLATPNTFNVPFPPPGRLTPEQVDNARKSGITAVNVSVGDRSSFENTVRRIASVLEEVDDHPDVFLQVRSVADIERAKRERKLGLILGFQGIDPIGDDISLIDTFNALGVKIMQLTYNVANLVGAGGSVPDTQGLTPFGREVVSKLNKSNVLVDAAHANARTSLDAIAASTKPIAITHSGARAIYDHQRSMPDEVLRALGDKGGVIGVYLMPFLGQDPVAASKELLMRHIDHALNVAGEDHVGIGSDLSITPIELGEPYMEAVRAFAARRMAAGVGAPGEADAPMTIPELNSPRRLELIAQAMIDRGHSPRVAEKVVGGNFMRLFRDVWGG